MHASERNKTKCRHIISADYKGMQIDLQVAKILKGRRGAGAFVVWATVGPPLGARRFEYFTITKEDRPMNSRLDLDARVLI